MLSLQKHLLWWCSLTLLLCQAQFADAVTAHGWAVDAAKSPQNRVDAQDQPTANHVQQQQQQSQQQQQQQQQQASFSSMTGAARRLQSSLDLGEGNWNNLQFNVQTGELFDTATHVLPGVRLYIIDGMTTPGATVTAMLGQGLQPLCYLRVGTAQNWASDWASFTDSMKGSALTSDADQVWVDVMADPLRSIISQRIDACAAAGYPAVVVDYLSDAGDSPNGLDLTLSDYKAYLNWLADTIHSKGMYIGAMNGGDVVNDLNIVNKVDFGVASNCASSSCASHRFFTAVGKLVLAWELSSDYGSMDDFLRDVCAQQSGKGFITIRKGTQRSTRAIPAAPRDTCPGPYYLRPPIMPEFPPGNWAALQMQLNFQIGEPFDFTRHVLPQIQVYAMTAAANSRGMVTNIVAHGLYAICHVIVGGAVPWYSDWGRLGAPFLGNSVAPGVGRWLDIRTVPVRAQVYQRLLACAERGFPAVAFDWVDDFGDNNGLGITTADYRVYLAWLVQVARGMGMSVGTVDGAAVLEDPLLVPALDFGITKDCITQNKCTEYAAMHGGKLWFNLGTDAQYGSYPSFVQAVCSLETTHAFIGIYQNAAFLGAPWASCLYPPPAPPPPAPVPAPPGQQLGAGGSRLPVNTELRALGGSMCLGASDGSSSSSGGAYTPCSNLTQHRVMLSGELTFAALGGGLQVGQAMFSLQRKFTWVFVNATRTFTADVTLSSTMTMKLWNLTSNTSSQSTLECLVAGKVQLQSKAYPGPGLSGTFTVRGNLAVTPSPWDFWDITRPVVVAAPRGSQRRRVLLEGSAPVALEAAGRGMRYTGDHMCSMDAAAASAVGGLGALQQSPACTSSSSSSRLAGRHLLATPSSRNASIVALAAGSLTALEVTTPSMDAVYNVSWLDPAGELLLQKAQDIPPDMVPAWRAVPKPVNVTMKIVLGVVVGVLGLAVVGVAVFIVVKTMRDRAAARR